MLCLPVIDNISLSSLSDITKMGFLDLKKEKRRAAEMVKKLSIKIASLGTPVSGGDWKFIGFNETELGKKQGEWCAANLPENANICYLQGTPGREAAIMREQGFREGIASRGDLNILSAQNVKFDTAAAMQVTGDWIQTYRDKINCIVSSDLLMISGAVEALKAADMTDVITCGVVHLGTWDADPIRDGSESYAVYVGWSNICALCADVAAEIYLGNLIQDKTHIELFDVTIDNYTEYFEK